MEINRNKVIFGAIGVIILLSIVFLISMMNSQDTTETNTASENTIKIRVVGENFNSYDFINSFKELNPKYKNKNVVVDIFPNFEDYNYTLMSAFSSGVGPDIFVLNNNEKSGVFSNQVMGVLPSLVNPNDFRKRYKLFFSDDLIETYSDDTGTREQLIGIPVGYEVLGIYYNFQKVKKSDLDNLSSLKSIVATLKEKNSGVIPIGIGNGTTVYDSADIVTQFFMLYGINSVSSITGDALRDGLIEYLSYGDVVGINGYNARFAELKSANQNSLSLFSKGEIFMVVGYPSLINRIKEAGGFSKNFLQVAPFPHSLSGEGDTLVNYNYFVINKDTLNMDFSQDFLAYLAGDVGATNFLNAYPYYLPALLTLEETRLSEKIDPDFNIILGDFYNETFDLSSFDKGIKNIYDKEITLLLDNTNYQEESYKKFRDSILCKLKKIRDFANLSVKCE